MKRVPFVSIILENAEGGILLLLRETHAAPACPNQWTLAGGKVAPAETPESAARRVLEEETGLKLKLSFWRRYEREHPLFVVDQYIYVGKMTSARQGPVPDRDTHFFKLAEIEHLKIGYGFDTLLKEYFLVHER